METLSPYIENKIMDKCKNTLTKFDMDNIAQFDYSEKNKLVYTSFDGDYMHFLNHMIYFCLKDNCIPLNPEAGLGYYISTSTHGDSKIPVMNDCIITELLCDEMWIFNPINQYIPEGVLAELMAWSKMKTTDVSLISFFPDYKTSIDEHLAIGICEKNMRVENHEINAFIRNHWTVQEVHEINSNLLNDYFATPRESSYIIANFYNYKHIDWARKFCYNKDICPICPQTLLPYFVYSLTFIEANKKYIEHRLTLLKKNKSVLWFINKNRIDQEIENMDIFSLYELYYLICNKESYKVELVDWATAEVPKYKYPNRWALTSKEQKEV